MKTLFLELRDLFLKERIYSFLLAAIVLFYSIVLLSHGAVSQTRQELAADLRQLEEMLPEISETPKILKERLGERSDVSVQIVFFLALFLAALIAGIWFSSVDLKRWLAKKEFIASASRVLNISWGAAHVVKVIILFLAVGLLLNFILSAVKLLFFRDLNPILLILGHTALLDLTAVFIMAWAVRSSGARFRDLAGSDFPFISFREIWLGLRTYLSILPAFIGLLILLIAAAARFQYEPPPHPLVEVFMKEELFPSWTLAYSLVLACVVGPVVEEFFFRGFFYPALKKYWGAGGSRAVTAALFAGVHENLFSFVPIFFLGLVLCYLYERRQSLAACISLHMAHNSVFIAYFFLMKRVLLESGAAG